MGPHRDLMTSTSSSPTMVVRGRRVFGDIPRGTKAPLLRQQQHLRALEGEPSSDSSREQGLSPIRDSTIPPDTPVTTASLLHSEHACEVPTYQPAPVDEAADPSMLARACSQTLIPGRSERDILRLADTIFARMQFGVPVVGQETPASPTVTGSGVTGVGDLRLPGGPQGTATELAINRI